MTILLGVVLLFAALSAAMAAGYAVAISRLSPVGEWRGWLFGWWRFGEISQRAGSIGQVQAAIYKLAVIAAVGFVIFGLILSGWVVNQRPQGAAHFAPTSINGWRSDAAGFNPNLISRPVASMPGAYPMES